MVFTAEKIREVLQLELRGFESHKKMLPPERELEVTPTDFSSLKKSSVILLLFEENEILNALLIKRPAHMKHHAGQIALPGGRIEENETAVETALRETHEEIGIKAEQIQVLGSLSKLYVQVSKFLIYPIVGWLNTVPELTLCKAEVDKVIYFPISRFNDEDFESIELNTITGKLEVPCIKYGEEIIWGATAMILAEFTDMLKS